MQSDEHEQLGPLGTAHLPASLGPAPCDDCDHRALCASGNACQAFAAFVVYGSGWEDSPRVPREAVFQSLFPPMS